MDNEEFHERVSKASREIMNIVKNSKENDIVVWMFALRRLFITSHSSVNFPEKEFFIICDSLKEEYKHMLNKKK